MYSFFSLFIRTRFRRHHRSHGTILFPQRPALSPRRHRRRERLPALSLSRAPRSIPHHALSLATTHPRPRPRPRRYHHDIQASLTAPNVPPSGTMISLLTLIIRMVLHRLRTPPRTPSLLVARCLPLCLPPLRLAPSRTSLAVLICTSCGTRTSRINHILLYNSNRSGYKL